MFDEPTAGHERWAAEALVRAWCGDGFECGLWMTLRWVGHRDRESGIAALQAIREGHPSGRVLASWRDTCRHEGTNRFLEAMEAWPRAEPLALTWLSLAGEHAGMREWRAIAGMVMLAGYGLTWLIGSR